MINEQDINDEDFDRWLTADFLDGFIDTSEEALPFSMQLEEILAEVASTPQEILDVMKQAFVAGKEVPR